MSEMLRMLSLLKSPITRGLEARSKDVMPKSRVILGNFLKR